MQISGTATELCPPPYLVALSSQNYSQNQLTKETYYDGAGSATGNITKTIAYTYDTAGNILSETKTVGTTTTTQNYTYGNTQWRDLLTKVGNTTISYDGGNPTNWYNGSKTYTGLTWQQGRQLAGLTVGETSVSYEYDADGIRTKMVAGDVTYEFVTQGGKLMRETATNSSAVYVMDFIYDNAGRPFAVKFSKNGGRSFTTFYYVLNLQGDVVAITKADGTVVAKYTYDAWGNLTSLINANGTEIVNRTTGTAIAFWNPLTYRGYIRDRETGFYYLQSRYYDPANHRFINADGYTSTGQGFAGTNMFAYCGNNPVSRIDSTGQFWNEIWEFVQNVVLEVGNAIKEFIPHYVGCGALALVDGPVPVLDVFAIAGAAIITVGAIGYGVYRAIQTPAKSTLKAEEKEKDITLPPFPTVIYRYGGTNPGNLTPKEKDKFTGLSFSTVPMPGAAMTTIEALNATGLVYAVRDGATHVSVRPIGGTMDDWINAGSSSVWTQAVKSVVIKIK